MSAPCMDKIIGYCQCGFIHSRSSIDPIVHLSSAWEKWNTVGSNSGE